MDLVLDGEGDPHRARLLLQRDRPWAAVADRRRQRLELLDWPLCCVSPRQPRPPPVTVSDL